MKESLSFYIGPHSTYVNYDLCGRSIPGGEQVACDSFSGALMSSNFTRIELFTDDKQ